MSQTQNTLQDVLIQTHGAHLGQIGDIAEQTQGTCLQIARNLAINAMVRGTIKNHTRLVMILYITVNGLTI